MIEIFTQNLEVFINNEFPGKKIKDQHIKTFGPGQVQPMVLHGGNIVIGGADWTLKKTWNSLPLCQKLSPYYLISFNKIIKI